MNRSKNDRATGSRRKKHAPAEERVVAVVGATGAVGQVLLRILEERDFPLGELRALASPRSVGRRVRFRGRDQTVELAREDAFKSADLVFFAATGELSKELAPAAVARGAIAIDKSGTWRLDQNVPLVVPEVNATALETHHGIIASPNCTTTGFVMALEPIRRVAGLQSVVVTTLQAVSGAGQPGIEELETQTAAETQGEELHCKVFATPIANNVVPLCEEFREDGYSSEELKLLRETRKIMALPNLQVSMTCVRVPVPIGHSATMLIETECPLDPADARSALAAFPGIELVDDPAGNLFPTPREVAGRDEVLVGRVRRDLASDRLWLWQVSDNLRKGAATNAVQIAEELIRRGLC